MKTYNNNDLTIVYLDYKGISRKKITQLAGLGDSIFETIKNTLAKFSLNKGGDATAFDIIKMKMKLQQIPKGSSIFPEHSILRFMEDTEGKFKKTQYYFPRKNK